MCCQWPLQLQWRRSTSALLNPKSSNQLVLVVIAVVFVLNGSNTSACPPIVTHQMPVQCSFPLQAPQQSCSPRATSASLINQRSRHVINA